MPKGTVKWFNSQKGYGFIQPQSGGKDVFVHISAVERAGLSGLNEGQVVEYEEVSDKGKTSAENLKVQRCRRHGMPPQRSGLIFFALTPPEFSSPFFRLLCHLSQRIRDRRVAGGFNLPPTPRCQREDLLFLFHDAMGLVASWNSTFDLDHGLRTARPSEKQASQLRFTFDHTANSALIRSTVPTPVCSSRAIRRTPCLCSALR